MKTKPYPHWPDPISTIPGYTDKTIHELMGHFDPLLQMLKSEITPDMKTTFDLKEFLVSEIEKKEKVFRQEVYDFKGGVFTNKYEFPLMQFAFNKSLTAHFLTLTYTELKDCYRERINTFWSSFRSNCFIEINGEHCYLFFSNTVMVYPIYDREGNFVISESQKDDVLSYLLFKGITYRKYVSWLKTQLLNGEIHKSSFDQRPIATINDVFTDLGIKLYRSLLADLNIVNQAGKYILSPKKKGILFGALIAIKETPGTLKAEPIAEQRLLDTVAEDLAITATQIKKGGKSYTEAYDDSKRFIKTFRR